MTGTHIKREKYILYACIPLHCGTRADHRFWSRQKIVLIPSKKLPLWHENTHTAPFLALITQEEGDTLRP